MTRRPIRRVVACIIVLAAASGCVTVESWQRGALGHRTMTPSAADRACSDGFLYHVFDVREGATGGSGKAGGGCGCN